MKLAIRKLACLALVIALILLPMAALAEAKQTTVTINNFDITINDDEPIHIDAQIKSTLGISDAGFRYEDEISSEGKPVLHYVAAMEDGAIQLTADGVSSVYRITLEEIEQLLKQQGGEMPFDPQLLVNYIEAYAKLMQKAAEMEAQQQNPVEVFEKAGIPMQASQESAEVMGETMELTRYDFELKTADFDKLLAASAEQMPEVAEYLDAYIALLGAAATQNGAALSIDKDRPIESLMASVGGDIAIKYALWTDETGHNMRMEVPEIAVSEAGEDAVTVKMPLVLMQKTDADGTVHMQMDMEMEPEEDAAVRMHMLMNAAEEKGDIAFTMFVQENGEQMVDFGFDMDYDAGAFNAALNMNVSADGDATNVKFTANCAPSGDASRVELGLAVAQGEQSLFSGALGFDVKCEEGALPEGPLMASDKPVINITEMTEEQLQALTGEGMVLQYTGLGALMANPGIAKIMADATSALMAASGSVAVESADAVPAEGADAEFLPDATAGG